MSFHTTEACRLQQASCHVHSPSSALLRFSSCSHPLSTCVLQLTALHTNAANTLLAMLLLPGPRCLPGVSSEV